MAAPRCGWSRFWDRILMPPKRVRPMGLIAVQMSINPFELFMLYVVCLIGTLYLIGLPPPSSVRNLLGPVAVTIWAANLSVGGLAAAVGGLYRRNLERGLAAYQFGWGLIGVGTLIYGLTIILTFPVQGAYGGMLNVFFSLAAFARVLQVQRFFKLSERIGDFNGPAGGLGSRLPRERGGQ